MAEVQETVRTNPQTDYERQDLSLFVIALAALVVVALLGFAPLIIRGAWPSSQHDVDRRVKVIPPAPRLQTNPPEDLASYLAEQRALLESYGWVDKSKGIAREPIDAAMQRLAKNGIDGFPKQAPK
ncbi:MAG: hypothetical protein ACREFQ_07255 [Stellaceae bacterium]